MTMVELKWGGDAWLVIYKWWNDEIQEYWWNKEDIDTNKTMHDIDRNKTGVVYSSGGNFNLEIRS